MEFLDILDEKGELLGVKKPRDEVHQKGYWHRVVHIWIVNSKGEVLIQKRSAKKISNPNLWSMSCEGHVSAGELVLDAGIKELNEELGLVFKKSDLKFLFEYISKSVTNNGTYFGNHFINAYLIKCDLDLSSIKFQEEEVSAVKWMKIEELEEKILNQDPEYKNYSQYSRFFECLKRV